MDFTADYVYSSDWNLNYDSTSSAKINREQLTSFLLFTALVTVCGRLAAAG